MKNKEINKEVIVAYLNDNWNENDLTSQLDNEIMNWVEDDWKENHDSEYDWYVDFGNGEAEDVIRQEIYEEVLKEFDISLNEYSEIIEEEVWDTINEVFEMLDK